MTRSYMATDIIQLPRMSATDAIALGTVIVAQAEASPELTPGMERSLDRLRRGLRNLEESVRQRIEAAGLEPTITRRADRRLDASWSGTHQWVSAWLRLPEPSPQTAVAQEIHDALFADGVRFVQFRFREQWVESQARLDLIAERELDGHFRQLGGERFLEVLRATHADYGVALGLTTPSTDEAQSLQERRQAFLTELRRYVIQVSAHADPDEPETEVLVEFLLRPLATWQPPSTPGAPDSEPSGDVEVPGDETDPAAAADPAAPGASLSALGASESDPAIARPAPAPDAG